MYAHQGSIFRSTIRWFATLPRRGFVRLPVFQSLRCARLVHACRIGLRNRVVPGVATMFLLACTTDQKAASDDTLLRAEGATSIVGDGAAIGRFRFLGFVTNPEGELGTERISAMSVTDRPGEIVVADLPGCQVLVVDVRGPVLVRKVGGCGEGPGEFGFIAGVAASHDTLFAFDPGRRQVTVIGPDGKELRRSALTDRLPEAFGTFEWNAMVSRSEYLVTRSVGPTTGATPADWRSPVVLIDLQDDTATVRPLPVQISVLAEHHARGTENGRPSLLRACVQPGRAESGARHFVVNHGLGVESVVLDTDLRPVLHTRSTLDWMTPVVDTGGRLVPDASRWYVACGPTSYALGYRAFEGRDERGVDVRGYAEVRRYDGSLVAAHHWRAADSVGPAVGAPRAFLGDTLVTVMVDASGWQRVALWEVRP
jgi:hypothetical protein